MAKCAYNYFLVENLDNLLDTGGGTFMALTSDNIERLCNKYSPRIIPIPMIYIAVVDTAYIYRFPNVDFKRYTNTDSVDIKLHNINALGMYYFINKKMIFIDNKNNRIYYK